MEPERENGLMGRAGMWLACLTALNALAGSPSEPSDDRGSTGRLTEIPALQPGVRLPEAPPPQPDYLGIARAFAECMIEFGRDRHGRVFSPLFANALVRTTPPGLPPYPRFADPDREGRDMNTPFRRFDFNQCINYPPGLGDEGPHKVTVYGSDPYEDRELYQILFDLSRITGEPRYRQAAGEALTWWFENTQSPQTGLYPWGEHLGWDMVFDCPTYFAGPSRHLYAACYHEVKDTVPFLDILARLPAAQPNEPTPLERYALGIWKAHFWDPEKAIYCRHGDYTGADDRHGSTQGYPAHLAAYFQVWTTALTNSTNARFREQITGVLNRTLAMAISRSEKYGFYPFTFDPDLKNKPPEKTPNVQSLRLARHAASLAGGLRAAHPDLAAQFQRLAELHLKPHGSPDGATAADRKPDPSVKNLRSPTSKPHAMEIRRLLEAYAKHGDAAYLRAAEQCARTAYAVFCDDVCPLPKYSAVPLKLSDGNQFPDLYFRGAALMHAFALLGEALAKEPAARR